MEPVIRVKGIQTVYQVGRADQKIKLVSAGGAVSGPGTQELPEMGLDAKLCAQADFDLILIQRLELTDFRYIGKDVKLHGNFRIRVIRIKMVGEAQQGQSLFDPGAYGVFRICPAVSGKGRV